MKFDLFGRNKIKKLEAEIERLWVNNTTRDDRIKKIEEKPVECFKDGYLGGEDHTLSILSGNIWAIREYLKIVVNKEMEYDPEYRPPPPRQRVTYKAFPKLSLTKDSKI